MIIVILSIVTIVLFRIGDALTFDHDNISLILIILGVIGTIITAGMSAMCIVVHIPYAKQYVLTKYKVKYDTINNLLEDDTSNVLILSDQIAEYNTSIMQGRMMQDNEWLSCMTFDFYNDLELIEIK